MWSAVRGLLEKRVNVDELVSLAIVGSVGQALHLAFPEFGQYCIILCGGEATALGGYLAQHPENPWAILTALAGVALLAPHAPKATILVLTFLMLIWQGGGAGLAANPWTSMVSKVIPHDLLGTFFGTQSAAFNGLAGVASIFAGIILDKIAAPWNFSLCFALTFVFMAFSFVFLSMTREPRSALPPQHGEALFSKSMGILRTDSNFRAFLLVRILSQFGGMAFAFYVIYAVQEYGMSDAAAGIMVAILLIGQVILSPLMGRLGDRWSHRGVMILGAAGAALSAILAWKATSAEWFYAIFLLEATAIVAIWTIPLAMSVTFAHHADERPLYIGMSNTLPAPAAILAPVIGGWLADAAGYHATFLLSAFFALSMAAALWFLVRDPRKLREAARGDSYGSDDISEVSWNVPTVVLRYPCNIPGMTGHHWSSAIAEATPVAHKGVTTGAKVEAMTAIDFLIKPELVQQAWDYFRNVQGKTANYQPFPGPNDKAAIWLNEKLMQQMRPEMKKFYYDPSKYKTYLEQLGIPYPPPEAVKH